MNETNAAVLAGPIRVTGLDSETEALIAELFGALGAKRSRNRLRAGYYDMKHRVTDLSKVLPEGYQSLAAVLGWSGKAVDLLVRRCRLDGFTHPDVDLDELGVGQIWRDNQLRAEFGQAATSSALHACAFGVVHRGEAGEPAALIHFRDALSATGRWDPRLRRLTAFLSVSGWSDDGRVEAATVYLDGETIEIERARDSAARWVVVDRRVRAGVVPAEVLPYRPRLGRPFGSSRLTRAMMSIQDSAIRTLLRLEGHMDVYSWPEFWLLGADESVFGDASRMKVMLGRIKGIPDDEDASNPRADVKRFDAASPEPHLAALNAQAKLFAREASLPDTSLAITDLANPTSAESYDASQYELIAEAEGATDDWSPGLGRLMGRALAAAHGSDTVPVEWSGIEPVWRDPRFQSKAQMADAGAKMLGALPWLAQTDVGLELAGLSPQQVDRALAERRRVAGSDTLAALLDRDGDDPVADAQAIKAKADAMGVLIRSGVDPADAARRVGLDGLEFTGAIPVSLRVPSTDAVRLED